MKCQKRLLNAFGGLSLCFRLVSDLSRGLIILSRGPVDKLRINSACLLQQNRGDSLHLRRDLSLGFCANPLLRRSLRRLSGGAARDMFLHNVVSVETFVAEVAFVGPMKEQTAQQMLICENEIIILGPQLFERKVM